MSADAIADVRLSTEHYAFHRRELARLRALAETATTKPVKARVVRQIEEHAQLIGLSEDPATSD